jgi:rhodanese-related sulfurtransferase
MKSRIAIPVAIAGAYLATAVLAENVVHKASFFFNGQEVNIVQSDRLDTTLLTSLYALPSGCTALCLAAPTAASGVQTAFEPEIVDFMTNEVANGNGLIIDARLPQDRLTGLIPTSVNIPAKLISDENELLPDILVALGGSFQNGVLNFDNAMPLIVYDSGPTTDDASTFITALIQQGYPADALRYYRGGMLVWATLGLTTEGTSS